jgi:mono/diheme cytochrome c family protein
LMLSCH